MHKKYLLSLFLLLTISLSYARDVHIALAADSNYIDHAGVAVNSVMETASPDNHYIFHVYATEIIEVEKKQYWKKLQNKFRDSATICYEEILDFPNDDKINYRHWGKAAVLRLLLPDFLPEVDEMIYLDCDMIALRDLAELLDILDLSEHPIAAVQDIDAEGRAVTMAEHYGIADFGDEEYINSGLLIMNLNQLREERFSETTLDWLIEHQDALLPDQDCINIVYKNRIEVLSFEFAWPSFYTMDSDSDIFIMHYVGSSAKPWKNKGRDVSNYYFQSRENSPWADVPLKKGHILYELIVNQRNSKEVKRILSEGLIFDINEVISNRGKTALHHAAKEGYPEIVSLLLQYGAAQNIPNDDGNLPIHKAAQWNRANVVAILIENGADPFALNDDGFSAVDLAMKWGSFDALEVISRAQVSCRSEEGLDVFVSGYVNENAVGFPNRMQPLRTKLMGLL